MVPLEEHNPYQAPVDDQVQAMPTGPARASVWGWIVVYVVNLPVALFLGCCTTSGAATFGMCIAVVFQLAAGIFATRRFPGTLSVIIIGGVLTALSQLYPVLQMFAGVVALGITTSIFPSVEADLGVRIVGSFPAGFLATCITAFLVILVAGAVGGLVQLIRSRVRRSLTL